MAQAGPGMPGTVGIGAGSLRQRLRLASGLVLFAFALTHFLNHAVGIVSLGAMEAVQDVRVAIWESLPGTALLYGAFAVHFVLALARTAARRTLRMPAVDALQLGLGLLIPIFLVDHVVGTRLLEAVFGVRSDYGHVLPRMWPDLALAQTILLVAVWVHGCLGIHQWLKVRPWYRRLRGVLGSLAILVPVLATWGWMEAARRQRLAGGPVEGLPPEAVAWAMPAIEAADLLWVLAVAAVLGLVVARASGLFAPARIEVRYPDGRIVRTAPGATLLEISHAAGVPHASVCGGRARCSTCRTRILWSATPLPPPRPAEEAVLARIGAPPGVRLACQIRPVGDIVVAPLLPARRGAVPAWRSDDPFHFGIERPVAILFVDIRDFTALSERRLPFDVVYLLRDYLETMSRAVARNGGYVDKFIGDAVMAIYGIAAPLPEAARQALCTAADMAEAVELLDRRLSDQLPAPLRIGIGVHAGPAILGRLGVDAGDGPARITALGDTVNAASRLEGLNKELGTMLALSRATLDAAGLALPEDTARSVRIRGREEPLAIHALADPAPLRAALAGRPAPAVAIAPPAAAAPAG